MAATTTTFSLATKTYDAKAVADILCDAQLLVRTVVPNIHSELNVTCDAILKAEEAEAAILFSSTRMADAPPSLDRLHHWDPVIKLYFFYNRLINLIQLLIQIRNLQRQYDEMCPSIPLVFLPGCDQHLVRAHFTVLRLSNTMHAREDASKAISDYEAKSQTHLADAERAKQAFNAAVKRHTMYPAEKRTCYLAGVTHMRHTTKRLEAPIPAATTAAMAVLASVIDSSQHPPAAAAAAIKQASGIQACRDCGDVYVGVPELHRHSMSPQRRV